VKECLDPISRKELEIKILDVFGESMQPLSKAFQVLLADDLVTAFESRLKALSHALKPLGCYVESASEIRSELMQSKSISP
jgi:hypothetical protein